VSTTPQDQNLFERIRELASLYSDQGASAAYLLCDRHSPGALAYRVVGADLEATDLTYGDLRAASERLASALAGLGVSPGDRVATLMGKSTEYLVTLMAIWRLGAVHVPLFTAFAPSAIALRLAGSAAKVVVCDESQQAKLAPSEDIPADASWRIITTAPDHLAPPTALHFASLLAANHPPLPAVALGGDAPFIHIYTSGTTGRPKGVVVPIKALAGFQAYAEFGLGLHSDDFFWCAADPGWAYGLYFGVLASFTTGIPSLLLQGGFDAQSTYEVLSRYKITNFAAAPTVYRSLRTAPVSPPRNLKLRCASSAGEPLTPEVNEWAVGALGVPVHDHYGQTEAGMLINNHHHPALKKPLKAGSMGVPMPGWAALVLQQDEDTPVSDGKIGRVAIELSESPLAWFAGYLNDPEKSAEKFAGAGRWYLTGDVGWKDEDGYFHFSSRDDDVIIMAGYRIGPFEVESVLATHSAVSECAVIAVPDDIRGEVLEAFVVLRSGAAPSTETVQDLQQWVKSRYAAHAYPRSVHFVESLPRTPSGKMQRFILRQKRRDELAALKSNADAR
jgi:acetyl-CoA synthetase